MFEYLLPDGTALPENEVIKLAVQKGLTTEDYVKKQGLKLRPKQKKPQVKQEAKKVIEKPEAKLSKSGINKAFGETEIEDPLGIKKIIGQDLGGDPVLKNIKKWEKKPKLVGPIEKEYEPVSIKKDKIGDYLTSSLRTEKAVETAFTVEEEEGAEFLRKLYAGIPNVTFEETTSLGGDISNVFDAVKAVYTDPITGKRTESGTLEFDVNALNASKKERPQIANKNADILKDFFNKNLKTEDLSKNKYLQDITKLNYNKQVAKAITPEFKAKVNEEFDAPDLFAPRKEQKVSMAAAGQIAMGGTKYTTSIVKPYEQELNSAKRRILKENPKISKEELQIKAERFTRDLLKTKAINDKKALIAEEIISKDPSMQANMYVGSLLANKEAVDIQNKSSVKLKIAETKAIEINSIAADSVDILNGIPKSDAEAATMVRRFAKVGIVFDPLDSEIVTLKNGVQVNKGFLNAYNQLKEQYEINQAYATKAFKEQQDNLPKLADSDIFANAASKNYDLSEKYLTNVGVGFSDLAVGGAYFTAKVLDIATPFSYAGDAISKMIYGKEAETASERLDRWAVNYTNAAADIRNSYTRDVSFDEAFSSGSKFGKFAVQEVTSQIPILIAMAASGGAATAVVGVTSAGTKMADMQTEMASGEASYSKTELWLKSIGYGGAEAGFSALTTIPILKRAKISFGKTGGIDVVDNSMKAYFKEKTPGFVFDQFLESSGEIGTQMTQNIIDGRPVMENTAHAGFSGFAMGTVISGVPYTKGLYLSAFSDYNSKEAIRNLEKEFNDLGRKFEASQNSEEKKALGTLMDEKAAERDLAIEKQQKLINNNLRAGVAQSIIFIEGKKAKLQNRAKEVLDDKNIKPENKELIIKNLRKEFDKFENAKQRALDPSNMMQDLSQFKVLEVENPDRYNDLIDRAKTQIGADIAVKPDDDKVQKAAYDLYLKQEIDINIENAGKVEGAKITSFETKKEAIDYIKANKTLDDASKAEAIYEITNGADGFNTEGVGQVLVKENMFANQRTQIATHEVGHYVTDLLLKNNPEAFVPIANQLLLTTKKLDSALYKKLLETTERDANGNLKGTEVVSRFLELVSKGDISFAEKSKKYKGLAGLFGSMVQKTYPDITAFDFKGETDMYNFVVGLGKKISAGTLTMSDIAAGSESAAVKLAGSLAVDKKYAGIVSGADAEIDFSKSKVDELKEELAALEEEYDEGYGDMEEGDYKNAKSNLETKIKAEIKLATKTESAAVVEKPKKEISEEASVKEIIKENKGKISSDKVQEIYNAKGTAGANEIIKLFKPITAKIVDKRRDAPGFDKELLTDEIESGKGGILDLIMKYDPKGGVPLAAYINKYLPVRAITSSRRVLDPKFTSDVEAEVNVKATETADQGMTVNAPEKPKYKNALESNILEPKVLESATNKIISTVRLLKNRIDAPVTLNRTVTPLIAEIRDEIGKQLDIDIKTMLGGKKDGVLRKELLKAKRYILENMTTTWLMGKDGQGGIPQAIQKQVDGKWVSFPDWVGKKIDRESVSTDLAGRTSGAELVRRLPNVFNNVSDEEFLAQIIGPDGNPIRGRKESVSKAMAEEIAFDVILNDFKLQGPIFQAFTANQERLGVEINDVLTTTFTNQVERGNIKFSKTGTTNSMLFLLKENQWDFNSPELSAFYESLSPNDKVNYTDFKKVWNKKVGDLPEEYKRVWESNEGVKFEAETYKKLRNFSKNNPEFILNERMPDKFNSKNPDLVYRIGKDGRSIIVELKADKKAPHGSVSNMNILGKDITLTRGFDGDTDFKKAMLDSEIRKATLDYLIKNNISKNPNSLIVTKEVWDNVKKEKNGPSKPITRKALGQINAGKDIIHIQGSGSFVYEGRNVGQLSNIPEIDGNMYVYSRITSTSAGKNSKNRRVIERLFFQLGNNWYQKSDYDIVNDPSKFVKDAVKFSKSESLITSGYWKEAAQNNTNINAVSTSLKLSKTPKGISVFDFDDTVGLTNSNVLYTMPDGSTGKLAGAEFAKRGSKLLDEGAIFDFSEFSKVVDGKPGPMVEKMKKMIGKFGPDNFFILTARPADAAGPIHEFLKSIDINIPLENITGLGNSTAQAKADWITVKAAEGYNDFYFADDALQNVEAVKKALDIPGVDSKVQQAKLKFSLTSKQLLKWELDEDGHNALFTVGGRRYYISLIDTGAIAYDDKTLSKLYEIIEENDLDQDEVLSAKDGSSLNLEFLDRNKGQGITDKGNAFKVISIVANGMMDRIKDKGIETLVFTAKEPSRIKLYNALSEVFSAKLGWDAYFKDGVYVLTKNEDNIGYNTGVGSSKAVKDVLDVVDIKSPRQQAKIKFSKTINSEFNKILEENTGVKADETFSAIVAKRKGAAVGKYRFFVPPSAADLELLTYDFLGYGKKGEEQQKFFNQALFEPYANGIALIDAARQSIKNDYKALLKAFPKVSEELGKLTPDGNFTYDQALRVSMWAGMGEEVPGLSEDEVKTLNRFVNQDADLAAFKAGLIATGRQGSGWVKPTEYWDSETIVADLHNITEKLGRKNYLAEFVENSEEMFSKENLNKIEVIYGSNFRDALEDIIYRMTNGTNRESGPGKINSKWLNWVNNSTGAIMFFNTRSAVLQTIGAINYLNWRDNNPLNAAKAFANQPQYWKDFAYIWNSDKMKERRGGLKEDVSAAEIANAAEGSGSRANAVISYLLKIGYSPTQIGDSFAIACGGSSFYRNRINYNIKQGMSEVEAEAEAWKEFLKITDQTQQSGDPRDVSQQQASASGRLVLAFQNTAMQQARLVKKAGLDLVNRRGDAKTNISKIVYYTAVQNIIFGGLQSALFATIFSDDDEEEKAKKKQTTKDKWLDIGNNIVDTILRGSGMAGAIVATLKNVYLKYNEESEKGYKAEYAKVLVEAANIAPPLGSKFSKAFSAMRTNEFEKDVIAKRGWSVSAGGRLNLSPSYSVLGKGVEAATNLPVDRFVNKVNNLSEALDSRNKSWQRIALAVGYTPYTVGVINEENEAIKKEAKVERKIEGLRKAEETRTMTRDSLNKLPFDEFKAYVLKKKNEKLARKDSINNLPKAQLNKYLENKRLSEEFSKKQKDMLELIKLDSLTALSRDEYQNYLDMLEDRKELAKIERKIKKLEKERKGNIYK